MNFTKKSDKPGYTVKKFTETRVEEKTTMKAPSEFGLSFLQKKDQVTLVIISFKCFQYPHCWHCSTGWVKKFEPFEKSQTCDYENPIMNYCTVFATADEGLSPKCLVLSAFGYKFFLKVILCIHCLICRTYKQIT